MAEREYPIIALLHLRQGRCGHERGPSAAPVAPGGDGSAVRFDDVLGDGQAETEPTSVGRAVTLLKAVEDASERCRLDSFTGIGDDHLRLLAGDDETKV